MVRVTHQLSVVYEISGPREKIEATRWRGWVGSLLTKKFLSSDSTPTMKCSEVKRPRPREGVMVSPQVPSTKWYSGSVVRLKAQRKSPVFLSRTTLVSNSISSGLNSGSKRRPNPRPSATLSESLKRHSLATPLNWGELTGTPSPSKVWV